MAERLLTLDEVAERLRYTGRARERSVRRLIDRLKVPHRRRGKRILLSEGDYRFLLERMKCSTSENVATSTMSEAASVSGRKSGSSKSELRDAVNARMRKRMRRASNKRSGTSSFTVVEGGPTE